MRHLILGLGLAALSTACGNFNVNELLVSKEQEEALDQLQIEAQYEYDKGNFDRALGLTDKALAINPNVENAIVLKSYIYLSKAGLDGFNISQKMIEAKDKQADTNNGESKTSANFEIFRSVMNLKDSDLDSMGAANEINGFTVYYPKSAPEARTGGSETIAYINDAIKTLCPLIPTTANPEDLDDARHDCAPNTLLNKNTGRGNFAWALAHLGEAIGFYSVLLFDGDKDGTPDLQQAVPTDLTPANFSALLGLNGALNAIFPTGETEAANSMLNAMFGDLETTSSALSSIPGVPSDVTKSVQDSIAELQAKINQITATAGAASAQNEALKGTLTTGMSKQLNEKIASPKFDTLTNDQQTQACCVYMNMNATAARPDNCNAATYTVAACADILQNN